MEPTTSLLDAYHDSCERHKKRLETDPAYKAADLKRIEALEAAQAIEAEEKANKPKPTVLGTIGKWLVFIYLATVIAFVAKDVLPFLWDILNILSYAGQR